MAEAVKDYQKLEHDIIRLAGGADNIASAQPVSYTHLDVYKRQFM